VAALHIEPAPHERRIALGIDPVSRRDRMAIPRAFDCAHRSIIMVAVRVTERLNLEAEFLAQRAAHVVADLVELLFLHIVGIDLEQQIGAALQIEAEHEAALRECRPGLDLGLWEEIRNGAKAHHQRRQNDAERLPPREIQH